MHCYPSYTKSFATDNVFMFDLFLTEATEAPEEVVTSKSGGDDKFDGFILLNVGNAAENGI